MVNIFLLLILPYFHIILPKHISCIFFSRFISFNTDLSNLYSFYGQILTKWKATLGLKINRTNEYPGNTFTLFIRLYRLQHDHFIHSHATQNNWNYFVDPPTTTRTILWKWNFLIWILYWALFFKITSKSFIKKHGTIPSFKQSSCK